MSWRRPGRQRSHSIADVVIVGDSITAGEHASDRRRSFAALVTETLRLAAGRHLSTQITGLPGGRVADLVTLRPRPGRELVVVEAGTNDWLGYRWGAAWTATPLPELVETYGRLLDLLVGDGAPRLLCLGVWGPVNGSSEPGAGLDAYDSAIAEVCQSRGGHFLPLAGVHDEPGTRGPLGRRTPFGLSDEMHPNDRGHALIASAVAEACASALGDG